MSKKNEESGIDELLENLYYYLKTKLNFDDLQASVTIFSMIVLPLTGYIGFKSMDPLFLRVFFIILGLDVITVVYSILKKKYFSNKGWFTSETRKETKIIIKSIEQIDELHWRDFEIFAAKYYESKGYKTEITQNSHDNGADVLAEKGKELIAVEVKRRKNKINRGVVLSVDYAKTRYKSTKTVIFTNSELTSSAMEAALRRNVKIIDRYEIKKYLRNNKGIEILSSNK